MDHMDMTPSKLCREFARILNCTPAVINGICTATRSRTEIQPVVQGREANSFMFIPEAYSFENTDNQGRALCLGETVILQEEVNPFITKLRAHNIIVTALHNHWLFERPRLMYIHFESIDQPLSFARKVSDALSVLKSRPTRNSSRPNLQIPNTNQRLVDLCDQFNDILNGEMHSLEDGDCMVMRSRTNIMPSILGRNTRSFLVLPQMFNFESVSRDGRALCSGETVILQEEINPFISKLRQHGINVTGLHNHWLFEKPRLMYIHFLSIDRPLDFANKVKDALSVLTNRVVRP
nr:DUF1259 domain-containing protein [Fredinandcohnia onubensis]